MLAPRLVAGSFGACRVFSVIWNDAISKERLRTPLRFGYNSMPERLRRSLRPSEQTSIDRFRQDVTLNRFDHVGARIESVGRWFHVERSVEGVELKHVVVERSVRAGSRTAV